MRKVKLYTMKEINKSFNDQKKTGIENQFVEVENGKYLKKAVDQFGNIGFEMEPDTNDKGCQPIPRKKEK